MRRLFLAAVTAAVAMAFVVPAASAASSAATPAVYEVTITNLTDGQPLSPPVAVTHRKSVNLFKRGAPASGGIEAIAEDGDQSVAVAALTGAAGVTEVVDVGAPLTPSGSTAGGFSDTATFEISGARGDRFSLATMLICTNDGFTGLNSIRLPKAGQGTVEYSAVAYDAGTEKNSEKSKHIVDPCSGLGPVALDGDPNGNINDVVDTDKKIQFHNGVRGNNDLQPAHDWDEPVATIAITLVENASNVHDFDVSFTNLSPGQPFSPPVVATHNPNLILQAPGTPASSVIEMIAEDGNQVPTFDALALRARVTDLVDVGAPLTPSGSSAGGFSDTADISITGRNGDFLSLATMLICTNDGLVLGDRLALPSEGSLTYYLFGWDAGTEENTELSADMVDPCSGLGPAGLDGDPNGNNNDGIDTDGFVAPHPGIDGDADLSAAHDWDEPVAMLTITRN